MTPAVIQRVVVLAAVALLAGVGAVALASRDDRATTATQLRAVPTPDGGWYTGLASSRGPAADAERTTCRLVLSGRSLGVTHPTLPCGAKIFVSYDGTQLLTEVIDTRLKEPGRQFELTEALARRLDLEGTQEIEWRFASR
ncbi:MAG: hypothetical protein K0T00_1841 [Gaiellaceae bacterium]|jgi:hypothetical protein|nr:hypothetical protein [Gaiellaceae bacterium]